MEAEAGVTQEQNEEHQDCQGPLGAGQAQKGPSPGAFRQSTALPTPWFCTSNFQNCERVNFCCFFSFLKGDLLTYLFFRYRWKVGEKHQCVVASVTPPTRDLAQNPGTCHDGELNWWPFGSQASTQSTEPHQPGLKVLFLVSLKYNFSVDITFCLEYHDFLK